MPLASIPQQAPSADALAAGRIITLNQASSRGVASYAATAAALQAQTARQTAQVSPSQPGVMISSQQQYPAMPKIARRSPLLDALGAPGTAIFQGIITNDDYNPDFYWRDAVEIYDQMIRNDGQIMAIVQQLELPVRRATWTVEPFADTPHDKEVASFIESCLFHDLVRITADGRRIYQKWDDILRHALMMLRYGFAAFEKVWRKEDGWVKLAHLMPMLPMSVYRWWVGRDNELVGIQQYTFKDYTYRFVDIPADKVLLFTHRMEGQNYEGFSLLRAAYKHWYYKDQFYKIDAIGLERNAIAVPFIELPASFNESDVSQAQAILANLRANESMGVTLPFGWKIGYIPGSEHYAGSALKSIEHHDILIARAVLAQFINLGSGETGTYNLAVDQRQDLLESLQAEAEYIEDTFNADLIPQLCDFNFSGLEGYPRIKASKLAQADITDLIDSISKLKAKDANFITPDNELEDWIRDQLGAPKATRSIIAGENPTAPSTPQRPDAQPGQQSDHSDAESKPVAGKAAPESQTDGQDGGGDDDGGEAGVSGAAATTSESLASDTKLLAESLSIIAGLDATERGLYAAERLESLTLFNPNHDSKGLFASGSGAGGGASSNPKGGGKGGSKGAGKGGAPRSRSASTKTKAAPAPPAPHGGAGETPTTLAGHAARVKATVKAENAVKAEQKKAQKDVEAAKAKAAQAHQDMLDRYATAHAAIREKALEDAQKRAPTKYAKWQAQKAKAEARPDDDPKKAEAVMRAKIEEDSLAYRYELSHSSAYDTPEYKEAYARREAAGKERLAAEARVKAAEDKLGPVRDAHYEALRDQRIAARELEPNGGHDPSADYHITDEHLSALGNTKSVAEVEAWAHEHLPNVDVHLQGADLGRAQAATAELAHLAQEYPEAMRSLKYFGAETDPHFSQKIVALHGFTDPRYKDNLFASYVPTKNGILLGKRALNETPEYAKHWSGLLKKGWLAARDSSVNPAAYLTRHEFGHHVDIGAGQKFGSKETKAASKYLERIPWQRMGDASNLVSEYAGQNSAERFAESFAALKYGSDAVRNSPVAQHIAKYLKAYH